MNLPALPPDQPDSGLRVTPGQRDAAVAKLREAASDGRLEFEELEARLPVAMEARTREGLYRVLADLVPAADLPAAVAGAEPEGKGEGWHWETPWFIETGYDSVTHIGDWEIPPFIEVVSKGGQITLNATEARALAPVIDIVVAGDVPLILVVPEGWGVDIGQVKGNSEWATLSSKVRTRPSPGMPRIVVRGQTRYKVIVRHPNWFDQRALRKWHEKRG